MFPCRRHWEHPLLVGVKNVAKTPFQASRRPGEARPPILCMLKDGDRPPALVLPAIKQSGPFTKGTDNIRPLCLPTCTCASASCGTKQIRGSGRRQWWGGKEATQGREGQTQLKGEGSAALAQLISSPFPDPILQHMSTLTCSSYLFCVGPTCVMEACPQVGE